MTDQKTPKEEFVLKQGSDNLNKVQTIIEEMRNAHIMHTNYLKYFDRVEMANNMIEAQIENLFSNYIFSKEKFNTENKKEDVQRALESGFVPIELFQLLHDISKQLNDLLCWTMYQAELITIFSVRLKPALEESKALDIKRDTLKELRETELARNTLFLESIRSVAKSFERTVDNVVDKQRIENKENLQLLMSSLKELQSNYKDLLKDLNRKETSDDLFSQNYSKIGERVSSLDSSKKAVKSLIDDIPVPKPPKKQEFSEDDIFSEKINEVDEYDTTTNVDDI